MPSSRTILFTKEFKKNIKSLARQYRKIKSDLLPVITLLESGDLLGDQIKGVPYKVYKARIPNTSASKGKQGGFRLIYYLELSDHIVLLSIYSKSVLVNISIADIINIINNFKR
ncbi:MAG: addiction module antitoxin [Kiritimatiellia bacterium]